ncbi:MAG: AarF/UbiB family protein [Candidatus Gastranaerophilales bacterium]|nr:AarF/UbiB family protein [Candidatus Gastranaerophilales bacterium]
MAEYLNSMRSSISVKGTNLTDKKAEQAKTTTVPKADIKQTNDEFVSAQEKSINKRRGLIAGAFDAIKSAIGYGVNKKSVTQKLEDYKTGKASKEEVEKAVSDYDYTKRDTNELTVDALTGLTSFAVAKNVKKISIIGSLFSNKIKPAMGTKVGIGLSVLTGMVVKPILSKINNLGTEKEQRKRQGGFWKNTLTGAIDGAIAPIGLAANAIVSIPAMLGLNAASRYITQKKDDKSIKDFVNQQANNLDAKAIAATAIAYKTVKGKGSVKEWEAAVKNVQEKSKDFVKPDFKASTLSEFDELAQNIGLDFGSLVKEDGKLASILHNPELTTTQKMQEIERYNLFVPKYLQMVSETTLAEHGITGQKMKELLKSFAPKQYSKEDIEAMKAAGKTEKEIAELTAQRTREIEEFNTIAEQMKSPQDELGAIVAKFRSDCPATRNGQEAQEVISAAYKDKYTVVSQEPLGVGTVAETFLAKDNQTGKEVVIKMLKKGMSAEKIEQDRAAILEMVETIYKDDPKMLEYFKGRANSLFDAWSKEVDLKHEMDSADVLAKNARNFKVVKPIEIKDNVYVMEKAEGVQFDKFSEYMGKDDAINLDPKDALKIVTDYMKILFEQKFAVPTKGNKVMHADPHGGNIFIDPKNPKQAYTMIDAGNVLEFTPQEQIRNMFKGMDAYLGYTDSLVDAALRGAKLPEDMTIAEAKQLLTNELKTNVYNGKNKLSATRISKQINDILAKTMRDNRIISDSSNTNLLKAEETFMNNADSLTCLFRFIEKMPEGQTKKEAMGMLKSMAGELVGDIGSSFLHNPLEVTRNIRNRMNFVSENKENVLSTLKGMQEAGLL